MNHREKLFLLLLLTLTIASCEIINPEEEIPAYLEINDIQFRINDTLKEGTASHNITDVWVFQNSKTLGVFELPASVPVLTGNSSRITIAGGIQDNGISTTRASYPFLLLDTLNAVLTPGKEQAVTPVMQYRSSTVFEFIEDFESIGTFFDKLSGDTTMLKVSGALAFEGDKSGAVYLDDMHNNYEGMTTDRYTLPGKGNPVYAELNYKCNNAFQVGIRAHSGSQSFTTYLVTVNPRDFWNKIYINLTDAVSSFAAIQGTTEYQVLIKADKETSGTAEIFLDNIKLLH